jgi:hypothetical protein
MSIATSKEERMAALAKLAEAPAEQIERDLTFWSVAKIDHQEAFRTANEARGRAQELYAEADAWVDLIAQELHRRRPERMS